MRIGLQDYLRSYALHLRAKTSPCPVKKQAIQKKTEETTGESRKQKKRGQAEHLAKANSKTTQGEKKLVGEAGETAPVWGRAKKKKQATTAARLSRIKTVKQEP